MQVYSRNALYKRDSMAVLSAIAQVEEDNANLLNEDAWPAWMSNHSLWLFSPDDAWRQDIAALVTRREYAALCGVVVIVSILGVFLTPQTQLASKGDGQIFSQVRHTSAFCWCCVDHLLISCARWAAVCLCDNGSTALSM